MAQFRVFASANVEETEARRSRRLGASQYRYRAFARLGQTSQINMLR